MWWGRSAARYLTISSLTPGSIPFIGTAGAVTQDASNLFWDSANHRLGIGTTAPTTAVQIEGTASGRTLYAADRLASSGTLAVQGVARFKSNANVAGTLSGAALTIMAGNSYALGNISIGKTTSTARLDVVGTISGSALVINGTGIFSKNLTVGTTSAMATISSPGTGGSLSEHFGAGSVTGANGATAIGNGASAVGVNSVSLGRNSIALGGSSIAIGIGATTGGTNVSGIAIGSTARREWCDGYSHWTSGFCQ